MRAVYKYYKERLIEISGKNRSLYSKNLSKKYAYDIGAVIGDDGKEFEEFFNFLSKLKIYFQLTQIHSNILLININNSS